MSEWHRCGRPTKTGKPCRQRRDESAPACNRHFTAEEIAAGERRWQELQDRIASYGRPTVGTPDCWSWPVTVADRERGSLHRWQAGRCAVCSEPDRVLDHDHETGWVRGYLCRGCNIAEAHDARLFERYRKWNPARMLGVWRRYESPFHGLDYGRWHGVELRSAVPVSRHGVVLFDAPRSGAALSGALAALFDEAASGLGRSQ